VPGGFSGSGQGGFPDGPGRPSRNTLSMTIDLLFRRRLAVAGAVGASLVMLAAGTAQAAAAPASQAGPATVQAAPSLPPLDPATLDAAIAGLPNSTVTGALVKIGGAAGHWSGTSGIADLRTAAPVRQDGLFRIGSVSKVFTAAVILQLAAEHRIQLDQPVQRYLPGLLPASYPPITVRQLLDHTSGLPSPDLPFQSDPQWFVDHRFDSWTPEQVVASAVRQPMIFTPGTQQQYAGINYYVAGLLVERVTGHSFAHEVQRRIVRPLGLRHTSVPDRFTMTIPGPHAHGYVTVPADGANTLVDVTEQSPWPWAEGGMISTAGDLTTMIRALVGGRLLPPAQMRDLFAVPDVAYTQSDSNCQLGIEPGRACFSAGGIMRVLVAPGVAVWGKTGSRPGYTTGVFTTADLSRTLAYSLTPTGNKDGSEMPYILKIATATFGPIPM
jgi:D-alanyl-D-alanine carboxypeptidase